MKKMLAIGIILLVGSLLHAQKPRARDIGVPFEGTPGQLNAITDVAGVEVGYSTIISGEGENILGKGPVRTGVTAIFPRGKAKKFSPVYANWYSLNGNGEMTGTTWVTESGFLETPIMITNTNSVGVVRDAVLNIFLAFSTANEQAFNREVVTRVETFPNDQFTPLIEATVQAVEEAIVNAMVAAETMEGINGNKSYALPHDLLMEVLEKYNRGKD